MTISRRSFLSRLIAAPLVAAALSLRPVTATTLAFEPIAFNGIPFVYDEDCPSNTIYFLNKRGIHMLRGPWQAS